MARCVTRASGALTLVVLLLVELASLTGGQFTSQSLGPVQTMTFGNSIVDDLEIHDRALVISTDDVSRLYSTSSLGLKRTWTEAQPALSLLGNRTEAVMILDDETVLVVQTGDSECSSDACVFVMVPDDDGNGWSLKTGQEPIPTTISSTGTIFDVSGNVLLAPDGFEDVINVYVRDADDEDANWEFDSSFDFYPSNWAFANGVLIDLDDLAGLQPFGVLSTYVRDTTSGDWAQADTVNLKTPNIGAKVAFDGRTAFVSSANGDPARAYPISEEDDEELGAIGSSQEFLFNFGEAQPFISDPWEVLYGSAVAVDGDLAVIGTLACFEGQCQEFVAADDEEEEEEEEEETATRSTTRQVAVPGGNPSDHPVAFVFKRNGNGVWEELVHLTVDGDSSIGLGRHVAISGDVVVVGGYREDGGDVQSTVAVFHVGWYSGTYLAYSLIAGAVLLVLLAALVLFLRRKPAPDTNEEQGKPAAKESPRLEVVEQPRGSHHASPVTVVVDDDPSPVPAGTRPHQGFILNEGIPSPAVDLNVTDDLPPPPVDLVEDVSSEGEMSDFVPDPMAISPMAGAAPGVDTGNNEAIPPPATDPISSASEAESKQQQQRQQQLKRPEPMIGGVPDSGPPSSISSSSAISSTTAASESSAPANRSEATAPPATDITTPATASSAAANATSTTAQ